MQDKALIRADPHKGRRLGFISPLFCNNLRVYRIVIRYDVTLRYYDWMNEMARPRAASDEQIIATAEALADEKGWKAVYAKEVREKLARGGSLSTFTQVINAWRAKKAENEEVEAPASEIVEDRASVLDDGLSAVVDTLKSMRMAVTAEIDRAVTDERKKSDRIRADERDLYEKSTAILRAEIQALQSENADLAEEAGSEATLADTAENLAASKDETIDQLQQDIANLEEAAKQVPDLLFKIESLNSAVDDLKASTAAQIATAEDREKAASAAQAATEKKTEDLRGELKAVSWPCTHEGVQNGKTSMRVSLGSSEQRYEST